MAGTATESSSMIERLMDQIEILLEGSHPKAVHVAHIEESINSMLAEHNHTARDYIKLTDVDYNILAYARYMLSIAYLVQGRGDKADRHLLSLGLRWRLSSPVWVPQTMRAAPTQIIFPKGNVRAWDQCLPPVAVHSLRVHDVMRYLNV